MPVDGSVIIEVKTDTSQADKDLAKLKAKIEKTEQDIVSKRKKRDPVIIEVKTDTSQADKDLAKLKAKIEETEQEITQAQDRRRASLRLFENITKEQEKSAKLARGSTFVGALEKLLKESGRMPQEADIFSGYFSDEQIESFSAELGGKIDKEIKQNQYELRLHNDYINKLKEQRERFIETIPSHDEIREKTQELDALKEEYVKIEQAIAEAEAAERKVSNQHIVDLVQELKQLTARKTELESKKIGLGQEKYDQTISRIKEIKAELKSYEESLHSPVNSDTSDTADAADNYSDKLKEIADNAVVANQHIVDLTQELAQLKARMAELKEAGIGSGYQEYDQVAARIKEINAELKEYNNGVTQNVGGGAEPVNRTAEAFKWLAQNIRAAVESALRLGSKAVSAGLRGLGSLARAAANGFKSIGDVAKRSMSGIISMVGKAASGLQNLFRHSEKSNRSFASGFFQILRYSLGIRSLYTLFNKLRSAISTGFSNLAAFSSETNASLTMMKNALLQLENALATAFAPILNTIAPILTQFISMLSAAADAVARLMAMLTGKTSYVRATKVQQGLSKGISGTGKAAKAAAKEAKGFLAAIDEINQVPKDSGSGSGGGGGGGGGSGLDVSDMFEEVPIEPFNFESWGEALSAFLDYLISDAIPRLKETFGKFAEWFNGFNQKVYDMFTFPGVKEKVAQVGLDLADAFNYLVNKLDWELWGRAIGAGLDFALTFLKNFLYGFDWVGMGNSLAQFINGLVAEVDWYQFGQVLWGKFKAALETLAGFLLGLDMPELAKAASNIIRGFFDSMAETVLSIPWEQIGTQIATFINSFDWDGALSSMATAISAAINGIFHMMESVVTKLKWGEIGAAIGKNVFKLFSSIDWDSVINTISSSLKGIAQLFIGFVDSIPWPEVGTKIVNAINNFDWPGTLSVLADAIVRGLNAAIDTLYKIVSNLDWNQIVTSIGNAINTIFLGTNWNDFFDGLNNLVLGILQAILDLLDTLRWEEILDKIKEGFGKIQWREIGTKVGEVLGAIPWMDIIKTVGGVIWDAFKGMLAGLFDTDSGKVILGFIAALGGIKLAFSAVDLAMTVMDWVSKAAGHFPIFETAASGLSAGLGGILSGIAGLFSPTGLLIAAIALAVVLFITHFDEIKEAAKELFTGMLEGLRNGWENVKKFFSDAWNFILDGFKNFFGIHSPSTVMAEMGEDLDAGLLQGISDNWEPIPDFLGESCTEIQNNINDAWSNIEDNTSDTWQSISGNLETTWADISSTEDVNFSAMRDDISQKWTDTSTDTSTRWSEIESQLDTAWGSIETNEQGKFSSMQNDIGQKWTDTSTDTSNQWSGISHELDSKWITISTNEQGKFSGMQRDIGQKWQDTSTDTSTKWGGISRNLETTWGNIATNSDRKFSSVRDSVIGAFESICTKIKTPVNAIIGFVERMVNGIINGINSMTRALNKLHIDIPSGLPGIGGASIGFNIPSIPTVSIPRLAAGAVIPPNREFMAVLGDQKSGNNIEAPEALIRRIVREETGNSGNSQVVSLLQQILQSVNNKDFSVNLDGKNLMQSVDKAKRERGVGIMSGGVWG